MIENDRDLYARLPRLLLLLLLLLLFVRKYRGIIRTIYGNTKVEQTPHKKKHRMYAYACVHRRLSKLWS